ncbi:hypothetical protein GCM10010191_05600 [Actinomadura vinacea]|uniref:DUF600 family protein n=1 Tax=Actinomadura vinacea TaxID=115336 RepID=A0ABN3IE57_9ACTN
MALRPPLDPIEQRELLDDLTGLVVDAMPDGWRELIIDYRQLGGHRHVATGLTGADGAMRVWEPPDRAWDLFARLREGMYVPDAGAWYSCRYILEAPRSFRTIYNMAAEPAFNPPPPEHAFVVEQEYFPRSEANRPAWFRDGLARAVKND